MKQAALLALLLTLPALSARAGDGKHCALINDCRVKQSSRQEHKHATYLRHLKVDELCTGDEHSLPLEGGQELTLTLKGAQAEAKLSQGGAALATKAFSLKAEKFILRYEAKAPGELAAEITCTKK